MVVTTMSAGLGTVQGVSCRLGHTQHHAVFALLNLAELFCAIHFGQRTSGSHLRRRALIAGSAALNVAFHVLLGGICASPYVSAVVHAHFATFPVIRLAGALFVVNGLVAAAVTAHLVNFESEGAARMAKLGLLAVLALMNILLQGWWWTHNLQEETVLWLYLPATLLNVTNMSYIYAATKSHAISLVLCMSPVALILMSALNVSFPVDLDTG